MAEKGCLVSNSYREIQETLLDKTIYALSLIIIPTLAVSLFRFFEMGWQPAFGLHIILAFFILGFAFKRKLIPYNIKVSFLIILFYLLGVISALNFGMAGFLIPYLMLCVFIAISFTSRKFALIMYFSSALTISVIAVLVVKGIIPFEKDPAAYITMPLSWLSILFAFLCITGLVILIVGKIGYILAEKVDALEKANQEINTLQGILPICAKCKKIRDGDGYWSQVETYIEGHSKAQFSHGLCKECADELYGNEPWYQKRKNKDT